MSRSTALITHEACLRHDPGPDHADAPARIAALLNALHGDLAVRGVLVGLRAAPATEPDLLRVHTREHVVQVREAALRAARDGGRVWVDQDTPVGPGSYEAAVAAAGCAITAARCVAGGPFRAALALARPPGHHATPDRAMGFCLFNNVAVAVRRVQAEGRARRVLVVDWDAHHGNGTQDVFWQDPWVYVLSVHLEDDYPGTGAAGELGGGPGLGTTLNVPLPAGTGPQAYRERFRAALDRALGAFQPDLVMISAGLDLLTGDPEGGFLLEPDDLFQLTRDLIERLPAGAGVAAVLEGGYALERIGPAAVALVRALAEIAPGEIPSFG